MPANTARTEENSIVELNNAQLCHEWEEKCGAAHFKRVEKFQSIIDEIENLKIIDETFETAVRNGDAVILELLPYVKQIRVRAAIDVGALVAQRLPKHSWTLVFNNSIKKTNPILKIVKLLNVTQLFDTPLALKKVLSN